MYPYLYSNGKKYNRRKLTYKKSHYKRLLPENNIRNYANWLKQEYDLSCYPKHVRIRYTYFDFYYDLEYKYSNRYPKHSSWKNKKFRHQYDHNIKRP